MQATEQFFLGLQYMGPTSSAAKRDAGDLGPALHSSTLDLIRICACVCQTAHTLCGGMNFWSTPTDFGVRQFKSRTKERRYGSALEMAGR